MALQSAIFYPRFYPFTISTDLNTGQHTLTEHGQDLDIAELGLLYAR